MKKRLAFGTRGARPVGRVRQTKLYEAIAGGSRSVNGGGQQASRAAVS